MGEKEDSGNKLILKEIGLILPKYFHASECLYQYPKQFPEFFKMYKELLISCFIYRLREVGLELTRLVEFLEDLFLEGVLKIQFVRRTNNSSFIVYECILDKTLANIIVLHDINDIPLEAIK